MKASNSTTDELVLKKRHQKEVELKEKLEYVDSFILRNPTIYVEKIKRNVNSKSVVFRGDVYPSKSYLVRSLNITDNQLKKLLLSGEVRYHNTVEKL
jgi:hypothetical protein